MPLIPLISIWLINDWHASFLRVQIYVVISLLFTIYINVVFVKNNSIKMLLGKNPKFYWLLLACTHWGLNL